VAVVILKKKKKKLNAADNSEKVIHPGVNYCNTPGYYCQRRAYFVTVAVSWVIFFVV